jgi:hypothetical protein
MPSIKLFSFLLILLLVSCSKEKDETSTVTGTLSLEVHAVHHTLDVAGIVIYLKKNSTSFPGNDSSIYNYKGTTDGYGKYTFEKLFPGNYYVLASGYDSLWHTNVTGNIPVTLETSTLNNNEAFVTVNVSE